MARYRNERFKAGNRVTLYYNPIVVTSGRFFSGLIDYTDPAYKILRYDAITSTSASSDNIFCCSSFGGIVDTAMTGSYSSEYGSLTESGDSAYESSFIDVKVPVDCFNDNYSDYIVGFDAIGYVFDDSSSNISDCYISEYETSAEYGKYGRYGVNHLVKPEDYITIIVPTDNYDIIAQMMMSQAIAVKSCDETAEETPDIPSGYTEIFPYGGGSLNPIVRMGSIETNSITSRRGINNYELKIRLVG